MIYLIKIFLIVFIEFNIYHLWGIAIEKTKYFPKNENLLERCITGFLLYHSIFCVIGFICEMTDQSLNFVSIIWSIIIITSCVMIMLKLNGEIKESIVTFSKKCLSAKMYIIPLVLLIIFLIYFVSINGQSDIDARTYIGQVTSMYDTNKLVGIRITSGQDVDHVAFKRIFAVIGINSAVLCNIYKLHPLIFCRTVRAIINILFLVISTFKLFKFIFRRSKDCINDSIIASMLALSFLFLFRNTIFTSSSFILNRTYEGKAYCAGTLVLMAFYLSLMYWEKQEKKYFSLFFIYLVAALSISASATIIPPLIIGGLVFPNILVNKRWKHMALLLLSLTPNIIYVIITIFGFAGFSLEG